MTSILNYLYGVNRARYAFYYNYRTVTKPSNCCIVSSNEVAFHSENGSIGSCELMTNPSFLVFSRLNGRIETKPIPLKEVIKVYENYGIVGVLNSAFESYCIFITKRKVVAKFDRKLVYRILEVCRSYLILYDLGRSSSSLEIQHAHRLGKDLARQTAILHQKLFLKHTIFLRRRIPRFDEYSSTEDFESPKLCSTDS
jgi:hypothetical protein